MASQTQNQEKYTNNHTSTRFVEREREQEDLDEKLQVDIIGLWGGTLRLLALSAGDQIDTLQLQRHRVTNGMTEIMVVVGSLRIGRGVWRWRVPLQLMLELLLPLGGED